MLDSARWHPREILRWLGRLPASCVCMASVPVSSLSFCLSLQLFVSSTEPSSLFSSVERRERYVRGSKAVPALHSFSFDWWGRVWLQSACERNHKQLQRFLWGKPTADRWCCVLQLCSKRHLSALLHYWELSATSCMNSKSLTVYSYF